MLGERIKLARKKAGFSLRGLAEELNGLVSAQAIGKYERDEMVPSSDVLLALSKKLNVSVPYLLASDGTELGSLEFRRKSTTSAKERARVEVEVLEWVERYLQIERILEFDNIRWDIPIRSPRLIDSPDDAEEVADEVRRKWKLGNDPIPNMTELLEERGVKVLIEDLPERVSGLTCVVNQPRQNIEVPVIVVNKAFSVERRRLTLAHELAHRVLDTSKLTDKDAEKAANVFAGAFLMPRTHLEKEFGQRRSAFSYIELIEIKRLYRVSAAALLVRLRQIDVISESTLTYAFQSVARSWRTSEPEELESAEHRGTQEPALRFERLCYRALAEGLISASKAAELLRISPDEIEAGLRGPKNADYR